MTDVKVSKVSNIELDKEDAYKIGSYFVIDGSLYVLSLTGRNLEGEIPIPKVNLIDVYTGIRWGEGIEYNYDGLSEISINNLIGDGYDRHPVRSVEITYKL